MTSPFTTAVAAAEAAADRKFVPMARTRGKLMIVRPLEYQASGFVTQHKPEGTDVVFCDIAVLDAIPAAQDEYGEPLPGFAAGEQFRHQSVLQGYLKGTFKRYTGHTLIGTIYFGPREKGKPPMMWQDLSGDPNCVARGQQFLAAHPEFLVPLEAAFAPAVPQVPAGPQPYVQPAPPVNIPPAPVTVATPYVTTPPPYTQPDPHAQPAPDFYAQMGAAQQAAQGQPIAPQQPLTTLQALRAANQLNHQGQPQTETPPF